MLPSNKANNREDLTLDIAPKALADSAAVNISLRSRLVDLDEAQIEAQFRNEIGNLQPHVTAALNRLLPPDRYFQCWWNGEVGLSLNPLVEGEVHRDGSIHINPNNYDSPVRWRCYIHELIHLHSNLKDTDTGAFQGYNTNIGWEEAVVESLQRHIRVTVLNALGVAPNHPAILRADEMWRYNSYIEALEEIRLIIGVSRADSPLWYAELLCIPVAQRSMQLMRKMLVESGKKKVIELSIPAAALKRLIK